MTRGDFLRSVSSLASTRHRPISEAFIRLGHAGNASDDRKERLPSIMQHPPSTYMTLAEPDAGTVVAADWIGKLFLLGRFAQRWSRSHVADRQLVIVLSVPGRDFAAVLVGCGWMSATPAPTLPPVREVLAGLSIGAAVRVVTQTKVFTERFGGIDARGLAHLGSMWQVDKLQAVVPLASIDVPRKQHIPKPGAISHLTGLDRDWAARICSPPQDLALVGVQTCLSEDLKVLLGQSGGGLELITNILLPAAPRAVTWSTRTYSAAHLDEELPLPGVRAVLLDGAPATRYMSAIEAPVIVSVLDRSVVDESVPEIVMNYRNTRGESVSLERELHWIPPVGVEALAFEVPL